MYNNQGTGIAPGDNQGFDNQSGLTPLRSNPNFISDDSRQLAASINNPNKAFAMLPMSNGMAGTTSNNFNTNIPSNTANVTQQGMSHPNMQANALMMMNSMQPMGGIFPFNFMGLMPQNMVGGDSDKQIKKPKKRRKKPKDRPKRPLSAYNLFFKDERENILKEIPGERAAGENEKITWPGKKRPPHGKISFESLAKTIGSRWKALDDEEMEHYKKKAEEDLERYASQMRAYEEKTKSLMEKAPLKEDIKDEPKRSRDEVASASPDNKRKKTNKKSPSKQPDQSMNMEIMNKALQGNIMAMNMGAGNYMFPMILNQNMMSNFTPHNDQLRQLQVQQQQQLAEQVQQQRAIGRQYEPTPPQHIRQQNMINQSPSFNLDSTAEGHNRTDPTQQLLGFDQHQHSSLPEGDRENPSYEFYNGMGGDQGPSYHHGSNPYYNPESSGAGPSEPYHNM